MLTGGRSGLLGFRVLEPSSKCCRMTESEPMLFRPKIVAFAWLLGSAFPWSCGGNTSDGRSSGGAAGSVAQGTGGASVLGGAAGGDGYRNSGGAAIGSRGDDENGAGDSSVGGAGDAAYPPQYRCIEPCPDIESRPVPHPGPKCPETPPSAGTSCADANLLCGYGDAPTPECRTIYRCKSEDGGYAWGLETGLFGPPYRLCGEPLPDGYCPSTLPANHDACTVAVTNTPCPYGALLCFCQGLDTSETGSRGLWFCVGPPVDPRCPAGVPNLGQGCDTQALECFYDYTCAETPTGNLFCYQGAWEMTPVDPCPDK
jgi:hypothetical protein